MLKREPAFKNDSIIIKRISQRFDSIYTDNESISPFSIYQYSLSFKGKCGSDIKSNSVPNLLLKQEQEPNSNDIDLSWNSYLVRGIDAINYELWYKTANSEYKKYNSINGKTYKTNFIKNSDESEICFKIKSIENKNFISSWSNEVCLNFDFNIPNAISPNGDQINDLWIIDNINLLPNNELSIFNQWNSEVFHKVGYQNNWGAENVPDGVYYYILKSNQKILKGYILVHH